MLTDSDRFAFVPRRIHAFDSTGNAYDASQCDDAVAPGHTLLVLAEQVVAVSHTWPFAVTLDAGALHSVGPSAGGTLEGLASAFDLAPDDVRHAVTLAQALGFTLDPVIAALLPL